MKHNELKVIDLEPKDNMYKLSMLCAEVNADAVLQSELYVKTAKVDLGGE